jgi:NTP pyrophosphatase (non-canonical NTP hydrolase)
MKKNDEILLIAQEECAEVTQAISKVFRFGMDAEHNGATNKQRLTEELGDLHCMIELLIESNIVDRNELLESAAKKREKLFVWSNIFKEEVELDIRVRCATYPACIINSLGNLTVRKLESDEY